MLLYLSITGLLLSVILLVSHARKFTSAIYLGIFFLLISLYGLNKYLIFYSNSVFLLAISYNHLAFLYYLIGPLLYWYVRSVLSDNFHLKKSDVWHLLPMLIFLVFSLPEMFSSWSHKIQVASSVLREATFLQDYKATALSKIFPVGGIYLSRPFLILIYALFSSGLFITYLVQKKKSMVLSRQHFMTRWLSLLLGFTIILAFSQILILLKTFSLRDTNVIYTLNVSQILSAAGLIGLLISPFFFPAILYGLPQFQDLPVKEESETGSNDLSLGVSGNHNHKLESDYLLDIGQKTDKCMIELQPYLKPDFNLTQLSVLLDIPEHHLAYYFREEKRQAFVHYRNEWRIYHAKILISEGKVAGLTLEAIGLISGFSNRNAFRTAFQKAEGISPNEFVAQVKK